MAKKKVVVNPAIAEIKDNIKKGKLIFGSETTLKQMRTGNLTKVYLSSNASAELKGDLEHYSPLANVEIVQLDIPNDELGVVCKKPFSIAVIGLLKG